MCHVDSNLSSYDGSNNDTIQPVDSVDVAVAQPKQRKKDRKDSQTDGDQVENKSISPPSKIILALNEHKWVTYEIYMRLLYLIMLFSIVCN